MTKRPQPEMYLNLLFAGVGAITLGFLGFLAGYMEGQRTVLKEAVDVGAAEYYDNYQTMNREIRWIVDEKRK